MPKSKRNKIVPLTVVKRKGKEHKENLIEKCRGFLDQFENLYIIKVENERNVHMKVIRESLLPSRILFGKHTILRKVFGSDMQSEYLVNLHMLSPYKCGLLFSDSSQKELEEILSTVEPDEFARHGAIATETIILKEGESALEKIPHYMEPELRRLGLPTQLKHGKILLLGDTTICTEGVALTVEAAQILKLLEIRMVKFKVNIIASWNKKLGAVQINEEEPCCD